MSNIFDFSYSIDDLLTIVDDAIKYTNKVTNNLLYDTGLNSPYRVLVEAQAYIYNTVLNRLFQAEDEIQLLFFRLLGFSPQLASQSKVTLKFELPTPRSQNTYFRAKFPARAINGTIFLTDAALLISAGSQIGYVNATSVTSGLSTNVGVGQINQGLQVIDTSYSVTNEVAATGGNNGESIDDLIVRVGFFIRGNGLITESDIHQFVKQYYPDYVISVYSDAPGIITINATKTDGTPLTSTELSQLQSKLIDKIPLGVNVVNVNQINVLNVYVEVVGAIVRTIDADSISIQINTALRGYLTPSNLRQVSGNTKGIIILNELDKIVGNTQIDYVSAIRIGLDKDTAYGQNFPFDPNTRRVKLGTLKVVLIKDQYQFEKEFN